METFKGLLTVLLDFLELVGDLGQLVAVLLEGVLDVALAKQCAFSHGVLRSVHGDYLLPAFCHAR